MGICKAKIGHQPPSSILKNSGFTLFEIIMVLVLLGILTAVAASRLVNVSQDLVGETERLKINLRFAQYLAMTNNVDTWSVSLSSASYTLQKNGSPASINFPDSSSSTHTFSGGVSLTAGSGTVTFDEWGSPGTTDYVITLSSSKTITITRNTGFIS